MFELYVDGLQKHTLQTTGIDAPELIDKPVPLLLHADPSVRQTGSQQQNDALADFCAGQQLDVNLSKSKVVVLEDKCSVCA